MVAKTCTNTLNIVMLQYAGCPTSRHAVNVLVDLASFGGGTVMLLATSELVLVVIGPELYGTYCYWPLIIGAIMCPAIWVGMPKHFWYEFSYIKLESWRFHILRGIFWKPAQITRAKILSCRSRPIVSNLMTKLH